MTILKVQKIVGNGKPLAQADKRHIISVLYDELQRDRISP
jgi:hypothetical protein